MPDMAGDIMPFCTSHFSSSPIIGQFLGENRWIKTVLEAFLKHFIRNVNHLAWPDPRAINGDFDQTKHFMDRLELIKLATSLGGVSSLANQPITNTHAALSPENRAKAGISESLVRLSVGIENVDMLIHDLGQALEKV
jgi:hypothetical protein